jgi:hypothetical protein
VTVTAKVVGEARPNVAVTFRADVIATVQVAEVPEQAPLQPANVEVPSGAAVSVTLFPDAYVAEQVAPQLTPDGEDLTVPPPAPAFVTVSANVVGADAAKWATTDMLASTLTVRGFVVPLASPLQPVKA